MEESAAVPGQSLGQAANFELRMGVMLSGANADDS